MLIAHISDLHLNNFYNDSTFQLTNSLLKYISERKVDHLIITGDITDNARQKDFEIFRRMLKKYGFLSGEKLSIIFGNHDIYGGVQKAEDIFTFPEKCSKIDYKEMVENFLSYFPEAFDNCFYMSHKNFFPFAKKLNDVLIVGINSIARYSKLSNPFGSNGEIEASQFGEIYDLLKDVSKEIKYKILMTHHHFSKMKNNAKSTFGSLWLNIEKQTMKLRGKRRLFNLFREFNVDLVLHGHLHESKEYHRKEIRFLNAGATIKNDNNLLKVNFINLTDGRIDVKIKKLDRFVKSKEEKIESKKVQSLNFINAAMVT